MILVTRTAATSKSRIASDCNRNSKNHCDSENPLWSHGLGIHQFCVVFISGQKKKTNKHKHFGRDGVQDEPSLGQTGPFPGTNWDPSLGQTGLFLFNSTVKSPFCPVCPWDGWGFVPGTIVPQGPSEKCLCVFCLLVFFAPNYSVSEASHRSGSPPEIVATTRVWFWIAAIFLPSATLESPGIQSRLIGEMLNPHAWKISIQAWKYRSRLKFSILLENFNPDLDNSPLWQTGALLCGALENFNLDWKLQSEIGRLKISMPERNLEFFHSSGPLGFFVIATLRFCCDFCGRSLRLRSCDCQSLPCPSFPWSFFFYKKPRKNLENIKDFSNLPNPPKSL